MKKKSNVPVKTSENTLRVVEALKELDGAGVTELANHLQLAKSVVHNHLSTLRKHDYVVNEGDEYRLGLRFLDLGGYVNARHDITKVAKPELRRLSKETGERANLLVEECGYGVYLCWTRGNRAINSNSYIGQRTLLHTTALGKAILAHLPEQRVEKILEKCGIPEKTDKTISDRKMLTNELETIEERGYAYDDEERFEGIRCVGVPIMNDQDRVIASISVAGPKRRMDGERFEEDIPNLLLDAANIIELKLIHN